MGFCRNGPVLRGQSECYSLKEIYYHPYLVWVVFHTVSGPQWGRLQRKMLYIKSH